MTMQHFLICISVQGITDTGWPDGIYAADLWNNVHVSKTEPLIQMLLCSLKAAELFEKNT